MNELKYSRRSILGATALGLVMTVAPATLSLAQDDEGPLVVFLLPENVTARWESQDKPFFIAAMEREYPGVRVRVENALNDPAKQLSQAEAALVSGAKVLVVTAIDQRGAAVIVEHARRDGVPVIAYDRLIQEADLAYYVSVDGHTIGELQGTWLAENTEDGDRIVVINGSPTDDNAHLFEQGYMSVLQPMFDDGSRVLVESVWTPGWDPSKAQEQMEQILTRTDNGVDAVLSANDGMAGGIIAALDAQRLAGEVPVTGLDGTLSSLQLILQGKQSMTVWRSLNDQASKAAAIAAALLRGEEPDASLVEGAPMNNGRVDVPWAKVVPMVITTENMQLEIDDGAVTAEDLCKGMPEVGPCSA